MARTGEKERAGIQRQIILPFSKSLSMCKDSIFVRLGRSMITASGIFLGVAFLCSVLTANAIEGGLELLREARGLVVTSAKDPAVQAMQMRFVWLVSMSLLVATVGIVNSMLMAVTERYKEIGTMKCLGALDSFIVRLFLLESGLLGLLGAIAGAVVGLGLASLVKGMSTGWYALGTGTGPHGEIIPIWLLREAMRLGSFSLPLWLAVGGAILLGTVLAVVAALYPAWRAAKMPPAAALRMEI